MEKNCWHIIIISLLLSSQLQAQKPERPVAPLAEAKGKLVYQYDRDGNRIPDFSYCGYKASEVPIPLVEIKAVVPVVKGDATAIIQQAINYVSGFPLKEDGTRGVVLLQQGTYEVAGQLIIKESGVVLRGSGMNKGGTILLGTGTGRRTLIRLQGSPTPLLQQYLGLKITDAYVPVNAMSLHVDSSILTKSHGRNIIIRRPSTAAWIQALGTAEFGGGISALGWKAGDHDLFTDRTITRIEGTEVFFDAPLTTALDTTYGGGRMFFYTNSRINNAGIENIRLVSAYNQSNPKDEDHCWNAIDLDNVEDVWVRQVVFENFAGSAVNVLERSKRITVEDCKSLHPVSEIGGQRRNTFFTTGQQVLFQRCYSEFGYHDFSTGYCTPGPTAFVQCESYRPYSFSGAIDSWSSGILFDVVNIDGNALRFGNRGQDGNGAGWSAANSVFWNCTAARIDCYKPPTAQNWSFGSWAQFQGDGYWGESNNSINPRSLFYAQLKERLNKNVDQQSQLLFVATEASSSPSVEVALELTKAAAKPRMQLSEWIGQASKRNPLSTSVTGVRSFSKADVFVDPTPAKRSNWVVRNGWLLRDDTIATGRRQSVPWWSGGVQGKDLLNAQPAITRFVPGRIGKGLTDDLDLMTDTLVLKNILVTEQNYGLWYDRRRDDHERIRRMDGDVWPPFYELPFARSGKDTAWDGLSKYDLTKYNPFYWGRLKTYADLADQKGLLLLHQNYFQHNIIEAGAHYADFPWRTANNINNTGFPEPPPYAGDKRIFLAEQFYDLSNPVRKELHRRYIRQCLENFKGNNAVIQTIGEEFTGPLHFVKFWLDVIRQWEKETGKHPLIALSTTKDVQDAILADPSYAAIIDIIDIRYWHYQADGTTYEPKGGQNLAPRQHARLLKPKKTSFEQVYRAVKEYRDRFPQKPVIYSGDSYTEFGLASLMAGGSLPTVSNDFDKSLLKLAVDMKPVASPKNGEYVLSNGKSSIIYNINTRQLEKR